MSPEGSDTNVVLLPTGEVMMQFDANQHSSSSTSADISMDPASMQAKIKELTDRISEVCISLQGSHHHHHDHHLSLITTESKALKSSALPTSCVSLLRTVKSYYVILWWSYSYFLNPV